MHMKKYILFALLIALLSACGEDDISDFKRAETEKSDPAADEITATPTTLSFGAEGGTAMVAIKASGRWNTTVSVTWLEIKADDSLRDKSTLEITALPNGLAVERAGTVTLLCGSARATISIIQEGISPSPEEPEEPAESETPEDPDAPDTPDTPADVAIPTGYELLWNDEFSGSQLNASVWCTSGGGVGVSDGCMAIKAAPGATTEVHSSSSWTYGIIESRILLPDLPASFASFALTSAEIAAALPIVDTKESRGDGKFHTYRVEWTQDYIIIYTDGIPQRIINNDNIGNPATWPFDRPFRPTFRITGDPNQSALMKVDYLRVFGN